MTNIPSKKVINLLNFFRLSNLEVTGGLCDLSLSILAGARDAIEQTDRPFYLNKFNTELFI